MKKTLESIQEMTGRITSFSLLRGSGWGLLGGLAGTFIMDLVLMGVLLAFGSPALTCISIVGNTVERFLLIQDLDIIETILLGLTSQCLVGSLIGAIIGGITARVKPLRTNNLKKCILMAFVCVEILSQPILLMTPVLLKMTKPQTLQWYGGSLFMHFVYAVILGIVLCFDQKFVDFNKPKGV